MKNEELSQFDELLNPEKGSVMLSSVDVLVSAENPNCPVCPPTFPDEKDQTYVINELPDGHNSCVIDTIEKQARRICDCFVLSADLSSSKYADLVPQIVIVCNEHRLNLLQAPHRVADGRFIYSELEELRNLALCNLEKDDATLLAKLSPFSLVCGIWDSRRTQIKRGRCFKSVIYAYDVTPLTYRIQYDSNENSIGKWLDIDEKYKKGGAEKSPAAKLGFVPVPGSKLGGVMVRGEIQRHSSINLGSIRQLRSKSDPLSVQRYILGLSLVAFTIPCDPNLRVGCTLVQKSRTAELVYRDGRRVSCNIQHDQAIQFAKAAKEALGVNVKDFCEFKGKKIGTYNEKENVLEVKLSQTKVQAALDQFAEKPEKSRSKKQTEE